ncbi:hypothetical protein D5086_033096 [Populus alba]|uniref:Uncharacterized protein n=1 Tax=Populus alba TaxID=43335 RepID=A0ACC4AFZ4_POPAL
MRSGGGGSVAPQNSSLSGIEGLVNQGTFSTQYKMAGAWDAFVHQDHYRLVLSICLAIARESRQPMLTVAILHD